MNKIYPHDLTTHTRTQPSWSAELLVLLQTSKSRSGARVYSCQVDSGIWSNTSKSCQYLLLQHFSLIHALKCELSDRLFSGSYQPVFDGVRLLSLALLGVELQLESVELQQLVVHLSLHHSSLGFSLSEFRAQVYQLGLG